MGNTRDTGYLRNLVAYDASGNIVLPANLTVNGNLLVATQSYVTTQINNLINGAPALLDTLDELAAALGDDANFASTITTSIAGKLSLTGGTLTGALNGTSASFSGNVSLNLSSIGGTRELQFSYFNATNAKTIIRATGTSDFRQHLDILMNTAQSDSAPTQVVRIANSGAATFSSSVTATNALFNSTSTQLILQNTDGGTNAERIGMFMTGGDTFKILSLNDNNTTRVDNIIVANVLSGNVGIGTTTPGTRLEVLSRAADADRTLPHNILTLTAEQGNAPYGGFGGAILFKNRSYVSGLVESSRIRSVIYDDGAPNNFGGGLWFETTPTPGGSLTPSVVINYQGRVGIGNSSPVQKLHVEGSAAIGTTGTEDILLLGRALSGGVSFQQAASLKLGRYQNAGGSFESYTRLDFALRDNSAANNYNTNTTVMTLTNAGNVGIGTSSPATQLNVGHENHGLGFAYIGSSALPSIAGLFIDTGVNGGQGYGSLQIKSRSDYAGYSINFFTAASNNVPVQRMQITSGGVVRIANLTSNGLVGTDASGNLGVVNNTYTEIPTGTISYSMASIAPWAINNSFPASIRNYTDEGMIGTGSLDYNSNINRGISFDLGSAKAVRKIVERGYHTMNLDSITVQYSTDNSNWTDIHVYRHVYGNTQKDMEFNPTGAISARYWRWLISGWTARETQNYYTYEVILYT